MNNIDVDAAKLAAMPLDELERLAAPVVEALRTKRATATKEERQQKRREYDRLRKARTVPVSMRVDDKESAAAIRGLVKQLKTLAKLNGRTVAAEVEAAKARMPVGKRKARVAPQKQVTERKGKPSANVGKNGGHVSAK